MPFHPVEQLNSSAGHALAEFTLPATADRAHRAETQVAAAVRDLGLSPARLEQLTRSVSEAVHNAMAQQHRFQMELPLQIRVLVSDLGDDPSACCWGFFVVARTADHPRAADGPAHHTIELFLYRESAVPPDAPA